MTESEFLTRYDERGAFHLDGMIGKKVMCHRKGTASHVMSLKEWLALSATPKEGERQ